MGDMFLLREEKGKITQKGTVSNGMLKFDNVNFVPELKHSLLSVSQICDKGFSTHFTGKECLILKPEVVIPDEWVLLRSKRKDNAYCNVLVFKCVYSKRHSVASSSWSCKCQELKPSC